MTPNHLPPSGQNRKHKMKPNTIKLSPQATNVFLHIVQHHPQSCSTKAAWRLRGDGRTKANRDILEALKKVGWITNTELNHTGRVKSPAAKRRTGLQWILTEKGRSSAVDLSNQTPTTPEDARTNVLANIALQSISRSAFASRVAAWTGCSRITVLQWLSGHTKNPTLRTYLAAIETLAWYQTTQAQPTTQHPQEPQPT